MTDKLHYNFFPLISNGIFPSCPLSYPSARPKMSLAISMISPVAEVISRILPWTFFLPDKQNQLPKHLLTHHMLQPWPPWSVQFDTIFILPESPNWAQHSRYVLEYPREEHHPPLSLVAVLVLVQPSRRGWPSMPQGHVADTCSTSSALEILPCSESPVCPPAQLSHPRGRIRTSQFSPAAPQGALDSLPCSPVHQTLPSQSAASPNLLGLYWSISVPELQRIPLRNKKIKV